VKLRAAARTRANLPSLLLTGSACNETCAAGRGGEDDRLGGLKLSAKNDTVDDYLSHLDEPKRRTLEALRRAILEVVPEAEQVISYRVPAFRMHGKTIAGFAAFKDHLSYLPFSGSILGQLADELRDYTMTKSALHFPVDRPLPQGLVRKLVELRLAEVQRRDR
jgi:uncharacterized protein YdhG (YjbR/CyaY superfamily)